MSTRNLAALILNAFIFPGLGTLLVLGNAIGIAQIVLAILGFIIALAGSVKFSVSLVLLALLVVGIAWIWSILSAVNYRKLLVM